MPNVARRQSMHEITERAAAIFRTSKRNLRGSLFLSIYVAATYSPILSGSPSQTRSVLPTEWKERHPPRKVIKYELIICLLWGEAEVRVAPTWVPKNKLRLCLFAKKWGLQSKPRLVCLLWGEESGGTSCLRGPQKSLIYWGAFQR